MEIFVWLSENKDWIFSGIGVTFFLTVIAFMGKKRQKRKDYKSGDTKIRNKRKNIYIFITGYNSDSPFSLDSKKSTPVDFVSWSEKLNSGGDIFFILGYVNEMNKVLKNKKFSEKDRKKAYEGIKYEEDKAKIMKLMIKKAIFDKKISDKIQDFSLFFESTTKKCFQLSACNANNSKMLAVYNGKTSFQFAISQEEYENVLKRSDGKIKMPYYVYFDEFMQYVSDKSIMDSEIIPTYLKIIAIKEKAQEKEIAVEDFYYWWISIG